MMCEGARNLLDPQRPPNVSGLENSRGGAGLGIGWSAKRRRTVSGRIPHAFRRL